MKPFVLIILLFLIASYIDSGSNKKIEYPSPVPTPTDTSTSTKLIIENLKLVTESIEK